MNFGYTGEPPVIFAQAAGAPIVYVAATDPSPRAVAILKPAGSKLQSVKELAGKTVAVAKGSSAHYLLVSALAHAGVPYAAVNKVFLQPADARAAFTTGAVDAWSIWDPFFAGRAGRRRGAADRRHRADAEPLLITPPGGILLPRTRMR